jgi:hypothetical protein
MAYEDLTDAEKKEIDEYWDLYHSLVAYYRQEDLYGLHSFDEDERWEFESMKKELQSKVNKDERAKKTQDSFVEKLKKQYNFKLPKWNGLEWFEANLDTTYFIGKWKSEK